jgi:hypothetical protein
MSSRLRKLWSRKPHAKPRPRRARPQVEALESREVPTVTYHGGALLSNVEVQAVYYGVDWYTNPTLHAQMSQLDSYLGYLVQNPYMRTADNAGYGVHAGTASPGFADPVSLAPNSTVTDGQLQSELQFLIGAPPYIAPYLQAPDANRLYVIFVQDNVAVQRPDGSTSQQFVGYHSAFFDGFYSPYLYYRDIHYVVIPYAGGSVGNVNVSGLSAFNSMTLATSRELINAVTDPDLGYKTKGWYDDTFANPNGTTGAEVGAITNLSTVWLGGYAVQRVADTNDQPMTPYSAGSGRSVQFTRLTNGQLWEATPYLRQQIATGVYAVSDQGTDNKGRPFVDFVTTNGVAYEYHDGLTTPLYLASGVVQAKAGQAVSYLLYGNGALSEYHDTWSSDGSTAGTWTPLYGSGSQIQQIDAGTDKYGVNAVDVLFTYGDAWLRSDTDGWHWIMDGAAQVCGGPQGVVVLRDTSQNAWYYNEWTGTPSQFASGVMQVTTGYDAWGHITVGIVYDTQAAWLWDSGNGSWSLLANGVLRMSKENLGVVSVLFNDFSAGYFDGTGRHPLSAAGTTAGVA